MGETEGPRPWLTNPLVVVRAGWTGKTEPYLLHRCLKQEQKRFPLRLLPAAPEAMATQQNWKVAEIRL